VKRELPLVPWLVGWKLSNENLNDNNKAMKDDNYEQKNACNQIFCLNNETYIKGEVCGIFRKLSKQKKNEF
jgi:hypothetical protein